MISVRFRIFRASPVRGSLSSLEWAKSFPSGTHPDAENTETVKSVTVIEWRTVKRRLAGAG